MQAIITFVHNHVCKVSDFFEIICCVFLRRVAGGAPSWAIEKPLGIIPLHGHQNKRGSQGLLHEILHYLLPAKGPRHPAPRMTLYNCMLQGVCEVDVNCDPLPARIQNVINTDILLFVAKKGSLTKVSQ